MRAEIALRQELDVVLASEGEGLIRDYQAIGPEALLDAARVSLRRDAPMLVLVQTFDGQPLAGRLAALPGLALDPAKVHTNIVIFSVKPSGLSSGAFLEKLAGRHVLAVPVDADRGRMVTHLDVTTTQVEEAADAVQHVLA